MNPGSCQKIMQVSHEHAKIIMILIGLYTFSFIAIAIWL